MRKFLLITFFINALINVHGQHFSTDEMLEMLSLPYSKLEASIQKNGYAQYNSYKEGDTLFKLYRVRKKLPQKDSVFSNCLISAGTFKGENIFIYQTTRTEDFFEIKKALEHKKFSSAQITSDSLSYSYLFQQKAITVSSNTFQEDTLLYYSFRFHKKKLPSIQSIRFAEDLLQFNTHEYLAAVFGDNKLQKDLYYFSESEVNKCTILFPRTPLQAVFIWKDELHLSGLSAIMIGGQTDLKMTMDQRKESMVGENQWKFQNGVYIGMSLEQLRTMNRNNFEFYAANSKYTGLVKSGLAGTIDFIKHNYVLACLNCKDSNSFRQQEIMNADEARHKDLIFFLLSVVLLPESLTD